MQIKRQASAHHDTCQHMPLRRSCNAAVPTAHVRDESEHNTRKELSTRRMKRNTCKPNDCAAPAQHFGDLN
eukprot:12165847-Alexandrium_andersonii.AAC.1